MRKNINIEPAIAWAENYIADFRKNEGFDPYAALTNTESKNQQIFGACVDLIQSIETAVDTFRKERDKITFSH